MNRIKKTIIRILDNTTATIGALMVAAILAILGIIGGIFSSFHVLILLSIIVILVFAVFFVSIDKGRPGSSAVTGVFFLCFGSCICLIAPAWAAYGIKSLLS